MIHLLVDDRYSMVLADNVDGGDDLDLIVTTMNGNVFCFSTPSPHHPLKVSCRDSYFELVPLSMTETKVEFLFFYLFLLF